MKEMKNLEAAKNKIKKIQMKNKETKRTKSKSKTPNQRAKANQKEKTKKIRQLPRSQNAKINDFV